MQDRSVDEENTWTCPDCGDVWEGAPLEAMSGISKDFSFTSDVPSTPAEWVRPES